MPIPSGVKSSLRLCGGRHCPAKCVSIIRGFCDLLVFIYCFNTAEDDVTIGHNAVIGQGAIVAAGSVVLSGTEVEPGSIYAGVPAKFVKKVDPEQARTMNERIAANYLMYASWFKKGEDKK